ncbi:hypothetical protein [Oceanobacter kriegii]|uniref:hypothetical protein n=1 Tax=Oceanobacter kriegii TaxID=64972 RepID=UPI0004286FDE|nr:hypothetical protein [Oceanobacter kriegii]
MNKDDLISSISQLFSQYPSVSYNLDWDEFSVAIDSLSQADLEFIQSRVSVSLPEPIVQDANDQEHEISEIGNFIGQAIKLAFKFNDFSEAGVPLYKTWDEFLAKISHRKKAPNYFYIIDEYCQHPCTVPTGKLKHYLEVITLVGILNDNADLPFDSGADPKLIFLHKGRLDIPLRFTPVDLSNGLDGISIFEGVFADESQKEQKKSILKECLYNILSSVQEKDRLSYLLLNFGLFSKQVDDNYRLFVSEFSFDEVRLEYEEKKRDYISSINGIAADVHSKMMGIPVSMVLLAFKIQSVTNSQSLFSNLFLLIAISVYAIMMLALIKNQNHTLDATGTEFSGQIRRLKSKFPSQYKEVLDVKASVEDRIRYQKRYFSAFKVALYSLLAFSALWFFFSSCGEQLADLILWVKSLTSPIVISSSIY